MREDFQVISQNCESSNGWKSKTWTKNYVARHVLKLFKYSFLTTLFKVYWCRIDAVTNALKFSWAIVKHMSLMCSTFLTMNLDSSHSKSIVHFLFNCSCNGLPKSRPPATVIVLIFGSVELGIANNAIVSSFLKQIGIFSGKRPFSPFFLCDMVLERGESGFEVFWVLHGRK